MPVSSSITTDITVLREMVRLAEARRERELNNLDRVSRYNLAIIGFAGSFLSLLVSVEFQPIVVRIAGIPLIISILCSLAALRITTVRGGNVVIDEDISAARQGATMTLEQYLLDTADLTNFSAKAIKKHAIGKKRLTVTAATFLALALILTYVLHVYAQS